MKIYEIVFSATGRTQIVTDIISSVFEGDKTKLDISSPNFKYKLYDIPQDSFCTCSIGIPLSIAIVAIVLLNLCGCTLFIFASLPKFLIAISTPDIPNRLYGFIYFFFCSVDNIASPLLSDVI